MGQQEDRDMNFRISNYAMQNVEEMVCGCVSKQMRLSGRSPVAVEELYQGKKNVPLGRSIARNIVFDILHNKYGFSYAVIAQRACMGLTSVMRCVRRCAQMRRIDKVYIGVYSIVERKLNEIYG